MGKRARGRGVRGVDERERDTLAERERERERKIER